MRLLMWSALRDELIVEGSPMESLHNRDSRLGLVFVLWWVGSLIWLEKIFSRGENLSDLLLSWTRCSPWYTLSFEYIWIWCDFLWRHFSLVSCPARWSLLLIFVPLCDHLIYFKPQTTEKYIIGPKRFIKRQQIYNTWKIVFWNFPPIVDLSSLCTPPEPMGFNTECLKTWKAQYFQNKSISRFYNKKGLILVIKNSIKELVKLREYASRTNSILWCALWKMEMIKLVHSGRVMQIVGTYLKNMIIKDFVTHISVECCFWDVGFIFL